MVDNINNINMQNNISINKKLKSAYKINDNTLTKSDSVEISKEIMNLKGIEGIRLNKVMEIKNQIRTGNYFTSEKLDKSLDIALDQLFGEK